MLRLYAYAAMAAAALALVGYAANALHSAGREAGADACEAEHARDAEAARTETHRREVAAGQATDSMLDYLRANLPPIETTTHETVERIRVVYLDHPVPAVCVWPERVIEELNAARDRSNRAILGD